MPDIHLGKGALLGSVIATKDVITSAAEWLQSRLHHQSSNFRKSFGSMSYHHRRAISEAGWQYLTRSRFSLFCLEDDKV